MDLVYEPDFINPKEIPRTMKAAVLKGKGFANLAVTEVPVPELGNNQLLCRVDAAGVCTSLLKIIEQGSEHSLLNGWDPARFPVILGDEGSLTVIKAGKSLKKHYCYGQRLGIQPAIEVKPILHRERYHHNAKHMHKCAVGYTIGGCLAQYLLVQEEVLAGECLVPLPDHPLPYFAVALAEPIACVYAAQKRHLHLVKKSKSEPAKIHSGLLPGGITVIIGAGIMGRINCELAMRFKPGRLIITDKDAKRLEIAKKTLAIKAKEKGIKFQAVPADKLKDYLEKESKVKGADDIITAVGIRAAQQESFSLLKPGGVLNLFGGLAKPNHILQVDSRQVHYDEIKIIGSSGGDPADLQAALQAIADKEIDPGNYVFGIASLEHIPDILRLLSRNKIHGRIIIYPHAHLQKPLYVDYWNAANEKEFLESRVK
jgi:L-iditol 2-dehydrogenase